MIHKSTKYVFFAVVLAGLVACSTQPAATVSRPGKFNNVAIKNPYSITTHSGDTLQTLAQQYHVSVQQLISLNRLDKPYHLTKGTVLRLPNPQYHVVQKGDTLFAIARSYGVNMNDIIAANNLSDPEHILLGSKLKFAVDPAVESDSLAQNKPVSNETMAALPSSTASNAAIKVDELAPLPASTPAEATPAGAKKTSFIPTSSSTELVAIPPSAAAETPPKAATETSSLSDDEIEFAASKTATSNTQVPTAIAATPVSSSTSVPAATSSSATAATTGNFIWPVQGKIISRFGPRKGGLYNDGVNISAPEGSSVKAAADGMVVYSGNELRGYGNLLLIKHNNGYVTAYAHTSKNAVVKDEVVRKGDVIAYVGQTGHVSSPQLHFSIRRDRKAVNPEKYLPTLLSKN